jgi:DNA polymerase IV (DinB-like DNA polymerase)
VALVKFVAEMTRWIMHVDMDAFFASVEQFRNHPELAGLPVCVGHDPKGGIGRGVVRAASYEARAKGIRSGMPVSTAYSLCPEAVFVGGSFESYTQASDEFMEVLRDFADGGRVRRASIDEAYIEVTERVRSYQGPENLGKVIQQAIRDRTKLPCSIGIAPNMSVAKVATGTRKPVGIALVGPEPYDVERFLAPLPVQALNGVGAKTAERLSRYGISTLGQIQKMSVSELWPMMGRSSAWLYNRSRGIDERPLVDNGPRVRKSISKDCTFMEDVAPGSLESLRNAITGMSKRIAEKLTSKSLKFRTVTLKLRYGDFTTIQRSRSVPVATDSEELLTRLATDILMQKRDPEKPVRLVGVKVSGLEETEAQLSLTEFI